MPTKDAELKKIAALAHLDIDLSAAKQLTHDLSAIMHFVEQLSQINTAHVAPLFNPLDLYQRLRVDEARVPDHVHELAKIAPLFADGLYLVPKVIDSGK